MNRFHVATAISALLVALLIPSRPCQGQNLIVNGGFDTDLANWGTSNGIVSWDPNDADGFPTSGSAYVINDLPTNSSATLTQCVQVSENSSYLFGGEFFIVPGSPTTVNSSVLVYVYPNSGCSGAPVGSQSTGLDSTVGQWTTLSDVLHVPATGASAHLRVRVSKTNGGVDVYAYVDNVFVAPGPIFSDGFESGTISAWL